MSAETAFQTMADTVGITPAEAKEAAGHILAFMRSESEDPAVERMIAETPGAPEAVAGAGEGANGIMALGAQLMGLGLDMAQMRAMGEALILHARAHAGDDTVDQAVASVPAIGQFI